MHIVCVRKEFTHKKRSIISQWSPNNSHLTRILHQLFGRSGFWRSNRKNKLAPGFIYGHFNSTYKRTKKLAFLCSDFFFLSSTLFWRYIIILLIRFWCTLYHLTHRTGSQIVLCHSKLERFGFNVVMANTPLTLPCLHALNFANLWHYTLTTA